MEFYTNGWKTGNTIFFNALGFRDTYNGRPTGNGSVAYVNAAGNCWTNGASSVGGHALYFETAIVYPQDKNSRPTGYNVRLVSE